MKHHRIACSAAALVLSAGAAPVAAQGHEAHAAADGGQQHVMLSDGWHARLDRAAAEGPEFTTMPPGWHVTTGPSGIIYHPDRTASGNYRVESKIFLFDPGTRREAFGIFIGGQDLDGEAQRYTYFVVRQDGQYLIKQRHGAETSVVHDWTPAPAVVSWAKRGEGSATAENTLAIEVGATAVVFSANGVELARVPRAQLDTEGIVGLRVNHGLNLHVASLDVTPTT
jgi:hypothetical protein